MISHRVTSTTALLLALLTLSSCGGTGDTPNTTEPESAEETTIAAGDRLSELGDRSFDGEVFSILDDAGNINVNHPDETLEGDIVNDAVAKRNQTLTDKYNIEFEYFTGESPAARAQLLRNSVMSGDNEYDLFFSVIPESIGPLATEGILADLCKMEHLSLDENWWSPLVYENCRIGGKMYYTTGDISPISYRAPACYYANETLLDQYKIDVFDNPPDVSIKLPTYVANLIR